MISNDEESEESRDFPNTKKKETIIRGYTDLMKNDPDPDISHVNYTHVI